MRSRRVPGADPDVLLLTESDPENDPDDVDGGPAPLAVVAHGAGSSGDFVRRAFAPALREAGWRLLSYDLRGHGGSVAPPDPARLTLRDHADDMVALARRNGARMLGGVSMGAHAAVLAALTLAAEVPTEAPVPALDGLLLTLPAWTGPPDVVAAANALQAAEIERVGVPAALDRICRDHPGWVADELAEAWPQHDPSAFAAGLRALADSPGPTVAELARIRVATGVVALTADPMHPADVARGWAESIPAAGYGEVTSAAVAADRGALGVAALQAWRVSRCR